MIQKLKNKVLGAINRNPKIVATKNKDGSISINCYQVKDANDMMQLNYVIAGYLANVYYVDISFCLKQILVVVSQFKKPCKEQEDPRPYKKKAGGKNAKPKSSAVAMGMNYQTKKAK